MRSPLHPTRDRETALREAYVRAERLFEESSLDLNPEDEGLDLAEARAFLDLASTAVEKLNRAADVDAPPSLVVAESFRVLVAFSRHRQIASRLLARRWCEISGVEDFLVPLEEVGQGLSAAIRDFSQDLREALSTYQLAVEERLREDTREASARTALRSLMSHLELSYSELGRMFDVSGETARRWEKGTHPVPAARAAEIGSAGAALDRLLAMFRPETLAQVIRREVDLFEGASALGWILAGRIGEVADRYELALSYQA